ncbi:MAG: hypothetical protein RL134_828 [Actinomycetota bacterium]|jgi:hypothetical protein
MTMRRRAIVAALAAAVVVVAPSALLPTASQAAAYRYWSYWLGTDSAWSFANVGPAFRVPVDGTIEGWRFSVSGIEGNSAPSFAADFDAVCGDTAAVEGRKRVAVVVDPGAAADAPDGEQPPGAWAMCVVAEERATGYDVLRAAATVRTERGLICGIGGYPARGCAEVIADADPAPTKSPKPKPTRTPEPSASSSAPAAPTTSPATTSAPSDASPDASRSDSTTPVPTRSAVATPTPTATSSSTPPLTPSPTPEPTYSLLTSPLEEPPSDSGAGGVIVAGIAVVGIAGLGAAAILRMRRSP